mmetsp:Transcript_8961/g.24428  ORF Transcript_8961/g.24428 Transcript_8961/m.24428 type:complete len:204 (-) Transcript_8961:420-1031(-)
MPICVQDSTVTRKLLAVLRIDHEGVHAVPLFHIFTHAVVVCIQPGYALGRHSQQLHAVINHLADDLVIGAVVHLTRPSILPRLDGLLCCVMQGLCLSEHRHEGRRGNGLADGHHIPRNADAGCTHDLHAEEIEQLVDRILVPRPQLRAERGVEIDRYSVPLPHILHDCWKIEQGLAGFQAGKEVGPSPFQISMHRWGHAGRSG